MQFKDITPTVEVKFVLELNEEEMRALKQLCDQARRMTTNQNSEFAKTLYFKILEETNG